MKTPYLFPDAVLLVFCKAPVAGHVKTRLMTELTAEQARKIHIELSEATLTLAVQSRLCPVQLWCAPSTDHPFFTALATSYQLPLLPQQGANLGGRMNHAFCSALMRYSKALIIGCDCPSLTKQDLEQALTALHQGNELVLAPAEDGGYVLMGLIQPHPELFIEMPWGTDRVLEQTRQRIRQFNLISHELRQQWDVDTPLDLARYRLHQAQTNAD
jgi:rSAM/selenodomain-associated transferase 1